ncbi:hypothetical protein BTO06_11490 [Tenacibaculum sp. SZ-18]|uniref:hypothetical protein n=1 Tax=Tenacibaculum sp. SZ-18 TaxID=754423 RepID=UPI000C2CE96D|nr:hypothetical protein [Tenacibaculum sp. SZ-18]AUC15734.1 hypothetical protein BTO06_11490 [Tenacibaculum sp. SZ-18]
MKSLLVFLLISVSVFGQKNINNYKYIVVPRQMEVFDEADKYQTSGLTKFLFNKNDFTAFLNEDDLPKDLALNKCLALRAELEDGSGMFSTKLNLVLKDCYNEVIFRADEGKSKIKEYKRAYQEALRKSFSSIKRLNYKYEPLKKSTVIKRDLNVTLKKDKNIEIVKDNVDNTKTELTSDIFAVKTSNGYQLKGKDERIVFELLSTSSPDVFIIKDKNGVLLKKNQGNWSAQYYKGGIIQTKVIKLKF